MKTTLAALLVLGFSTSAFAEQKYVCNQYDRSSDRIGQNTIVLTSLEAGEVSDGEEASYVLEFYQGARVSSKWSAKGKVTVEDVNFEFVSRDHKVKFSIYLDEMNESNLTLSGKDQGSYICR